jgi:hypothetical protein
MYDAHFDRRTEQHNNTKYPLKLSGMRSSSVCLNLNQIQIKRQPKTRAGQKPSESCGRRSRKLITLHETK